MSSTGRGLGICLPWGAVMGPWRNTHSSRNPWQNLNHTVEKHHPNVGLMFWRARWAPEMQLAGLSFGEVMACLVRGPPFP